MKSLLSILAKTFVLALFVFSVPLEAKVKLTCAAGEVLSTDSNGEAICVQDQDTNTNAETECGSGEYLDGDGNCNPLAAADQTCGAGQFVSGIDADGLLICASPSAVPSCPCVGIAGNDFEETSWETGSFSADYCDSINISYEEVRIMSTTTGNGQNLNLRVGDDLGGVFCFIQNTTTGNPGTRISNLTEEEFAACKLQFTDPKDADDCLLPPS